MRATSRASEWKPEFPEADFVPRFVSRLYFASAFVPADLMDFVASLTTFETDSERVMFEFAELRVVFFLPRSRLTIMPSDV